MSTNNPFVPRGNPVIGTEPLLLKPRTVFGNKLVFRDACIDDAAFILKLRTDSNASRYISKTPPNLQNQVSWLESYSEDKSQIYFIILQKDGDRVGTVRLYDKKGDSFCWGSWIIKDGCPFGFALESALMVYTFALSLGFNQAHFDVRKGNASVWRFHERFGATRIGESADDYFYSIAADAISKSLEKYSGYLPNGIKIDY